MFFYINILFKQTIITSAVFKTNLHVNVIDAKKHKHLTILSYYISKG